MDYKKAFNIIKEEDISRHLYMCRPSLISVVLPWFCCSLGWTMKTAEFSYNVIDNHWQDIYYCKFLLQTSVVGERSLILLFCMLTSRSCILDIKNHYNHVHPCIVQRKSVFFNALFEWRGCVGSVLFIFLVISFHNLQKINMWF